MTSLDLTRRDLLGHGTKAALAGGVVMAGQPTAARADRAPNSQANRPRTSCDVAIIGGGVGGLHTAYQLSRLHGSARPDVMVFEKQERLGGRILDVAMDPARPDLLVGVGALRVMETQDYVFALAAELGITFQAGPWRDDRISARGFTASNSDELNVLGYPLVPDDEDGGGAETETALYDLLRFGPERDNVDAYPDFRSYARAAIGTQGTQFLADVLRFRADFQEPIDARGYLDYLDEEWDVCCTPSYPVGGMSQFVTRMATAATARGTRIALDESIESIERQNGPRPYLVTTSRRRVSARRIVIATEAAALQHVTGDVAEAITSQPQFQDLYGVPVVTITQQWPHAWWEGAVAGKDIRRAWTTEHALNAIEIFVHPYSADQLVTRSVYDDDVRTVDFWTQTAARGVPAVEAEIMRGLTALFPGLAIPQPRATVVQTWPAGWYWLRGGSSFTNADIAAWAVRPLGDEPVSLVGESYNPQRSGWCDAAFKSSINALNGWFDTDIRLPPRRGRARPHSHGRNV